MLDTYKFVSNKPPAMESITSLKNAATRAIWGDEQAHQEPISGKTGDVSKGEPYDAGNMGGR